MKAAKPKTGGVATESHLDRLLRAAEVMEQGRLCWHPHHPATYKGTRLESGLSDRGVCWNGRYTMIEAKEEDGTSASLGRLTGIDRECGNGVKPSQVREMDRHEKAGVRCFVLISLTVPAKAAPKRKQAAITPDPGRAQETIIRIIPWAAWRALMQAAEDQRLALARWQIDSGRLMVAGGVNCVLPPKPTVDASIPAADLATIGHPCRTAAELLAAIRGC